MTPLLITLQVSGKSRGGPQRGSAAALFQGIDDSGDAADG
jgi:hypothetical protein